MAEPVEVVEGAGRPDWRAQVRAGLAAWIGLIRGRQGRMPEPMPVDDEAAAEWWLGLQEPRRVKGAGYESAEQYLARCRSALGGWLRMGSPYRAAVLAGITEDLVPYRGEPFAAYLAAVDARYAVGRMLSVQAGDAGAGATAPAVDADAGAAAVPEPVMGRRRPAGLDDLLATVQAAGGGGR